MHLRKLSLVLLVLSVFLVAATKANTEINTRIVGGTAATISQLPYLVNLRKDGRFFCGGTLVDKNFVVTAAHCVYGVSSSTLTVVGGSTKLSSGGVIRGVSKISIPKNYNSRSLDNDVAVLKLSKSMTGTNISPIGLCNKEWKKGELVQVSGWGLMHESGKTVPDIVQTVKVPLISKSSCVRSYRNVATLTGTMFCASDPGKKDSCSGDSGGPVIYNNRLCGIVSWGVGCARKGYPGVYTNVRTVMSFIQTSMK